MLTWIIVILLLVLTAPVWLWILATLGRPILSMIGYLVIVGVFFAALIMLAVAMDPIFTQIGVWAGPQIMEDYITPLIGFSVISGIIGLLLESYSEWSLTKWVWKRIRSVCSPKAWQAWWKRYRIISASRPARYAPYLWMARLMGSVRKPSRIQKRKDLCSAEEIMRATPVIPTSICYRGVFGVTDAS